MAAGLVAVALAAIAAEADVPTACSAGIAAHCPGTEGRDRLLCLEEHRTMLSDDCRDAVAAERGRQLMGSAPPAGPVRLGQACREDFRAHCADLPSGSHRDEVVACLRRHSEILRPDCLAALIAPEEPAPPEPGREGAGGRGGFGNPGVGAGRRNF